MLVNGVETLIALEVEEQYLAESQQVKT